MSGTPSTDLKFLLVNCVSLMHKVVLAYYESRDGLIYMVEDNACNEVAPSVIEGELRKLGIEPVKNWFRLEGRWIYPWLWSRIPEKLGYLYLDVNDEVLVILFERERRLISGENVKALLSKIGRVVELKKSIIREKKRLKSDEVKIYERTIIYANVKDKGEKWYGVGIPRASSLKE